jgi:hypothetical protein
MAESFGARLLAEVAEESLAEVRAIDAAAEQQVLTPQTRR